MVDEHTEERDPNKTMHVLQAVQWGILAWDNNVTPTAIANCWLKARVPSPEYSPMTEDQAKEPEKGREGVASQVIEFILMIFSSSN